MKRPGEKSSKETLVSFCLDYPKTIALIICIGAFLLTFTDFILGLSKYGMAFLYEPMKLFIYLGYPFLSAFFVYLFLKTKKESIKDELTQLFNSRYLHTQLEKAIKRARAENFPLSLLFIDIDNFKGYNDTYGHLAGDQVLARFGRLLTECTRNNADSSFRYGGDEFVVILAGADLDDAALVAERIQEAFIDEDFGSLTLSIGLAAFKEEYTRETFLKYADTAMYQAKHSGKDRVYIYIA